MNFGLVWIGQWRMHTWVKLDMVVDDEERFRMWTETRGGLGRKEGNRRRLRRFCRRGTEWENIVDHLIVARGKTFRASGLCQPPKSGRALQILTTGLPLAFQEYC